MSRFAFALFCSLSAFSRASAQAPDEHSWQLYINNTYEISFRFPQEWKQDFGYSEPYFGPPRQLHTIPRGFVQLNLMDQPNSSPQEACAGAAKHVLRPFGNHPTVRHMQVDGHEACLVLPSDDQGAPWGAELIAKLPRPLELEGNRWNLLELDADKEFIFRILPTLHFLSPGHADPPFALEIAPLKRSPQPAIWQRDQPFMLVLVMKNKSSQALQLFISPDTFRFTATTRGDRVLLTTKPKDKEDTDTPSPPAPPPQPTVINIKPHEDSEYVVAIRSLYDRQPAGPYSLQVEQDLPKEFGAGLVESNTITVKVGY